jgi:hypothetical protein
VIDTILLIARLLFVALLYLFLFAVMKTGIGMVKGQRRKGAGWSVSVERGPKELRGVKLNVVGPVIVGRSPGADIVIATSFVSGRHCRFSLLGESLMVEDLDSTNGTLLNGEPISSPVSALNGDVVSIGNVDIKVTRS